LLASADRAVNRVQAAARGEAGTVRLAYTLTTAYDTVPTMLATANDLAPQLKIDAREVFGGDLVDLFDAEQFDLAVAPKTSYPRGLRQRLIRQETFRLAVAEDHPLVSREQVPLSALQHERFELWPRAMAPGFYDAVAAACRGAGFEHDRDEQAAGSTVWGNIARGRGVALVVSSLIEQLPRGVRLVDLAPPPVKLAITAVWRTGNHQPAVARLVDITTRLAKSGRGSSGGLRSRRSAASSPTSSAEMPVMTIPTRSTRGSNVAQRAWSNRANSASPPERTTSRVKPAATKSMTLVSAMSRSRLVNQQERSTA
jgi:DNA-binding transcriptional LysR family regulator